MTSLRRKCGESVLWMLRAVARPVWEFRSAHTVKFVRVLLPIVRFWRFACTSIESLGGTVRIRSGYSCVTGIHTFSPFVHPHPGSGESLPPLTVSRKPPLGIENLPRRNQTPFLRELTYTFTAGGLSRLSGSRVVEKPFSIILENGKIFKEVSQRLNKPMLEHPVIRKKNLAAACFVSHAWAADRPASFNYYHWLIDVLPLLLLPMYWNVIHRERPTLILPRFQFAFQRESFALLDLPQCEIISSLSFGVLAADVLDVPVLPQDCNQGHPAVLNALRAHFLPKVPPARKKLRIYLTRLAGKRSVTNEEEIQPILEKYDIVTVRTGDMPFQRQMELFAHTELVIAPHGAALANIVFLPRESAVLEFFSPTFINPCYWRIAEACGCDYAVLIGKPYHTFESSSDCYRIDPKEFERLLERLLTLRGR